MYVEDYIPYVVYSETLDVLKPLSSDALVNDAQDTYNIVIVNAVDAKLFEIILKIGI